MTSSSADDLPPTTETSGIWQWLRPHWAALSLAFLAAVGETIADVLQPWPIKIVLDNVVQHKALSGVQASIVAALAGWSTNATLVAAVAAVVIIAIVGAIGSYWEKY